MPELKTAVQTAMAPPAVDPAQGKANAIKAAAEALVNGEKPSLAVVTEADLAKLATEAKPDFGYYFPPHGPPTRFKVIKENAPEITGWDDETGAEIKSAVTLDIGYPDGKTAIKKCPIATGPRAGHFVFGPLKTRQAPEETRGEEFKDVELGRNAPLNSHF